MQSHRALAAFLALALPALASAGWATFRLTEPIPNAAGPIVGYRLSWGTQPGIYTRSSEFPPASIDNMRLDGLPDTGSVYVVAESIAANGKPSVYSNVACFTFLGAQCVPGPFETDVTAVTMRDAGAFTPWTKGFALRATPTFVTDPADTIAVLGERWPTTKGGLELGWEQPIGTRNRIASVDARLAGVANLASNDATATAALRLTIVPACYRVRLAAGDMAYANVAAWEIRDGTRVLATQAAASVPAGQFRDATGVLRTPAAWVSGNVPRDLCFTSTEFRLVLLRPATTSAVMAHLSLERLP